MNALSSLLKELKVMTKHKMLLIASCIILFIPCIYAGLFIWSYWDPYAKMNELPIGVVNQDAGTTVDGKTVHIGKDLSSELKDNQDLDISIITNAQADKGLKNNEYYVILRIPKDFSKKAMSALDNGNEKAQLDFIPNEGYNYTAASIGESATEKIKENVANSITDAYVTALLNAQKDLGTGLTQLADGGSKVKDGADSAKEGSKTLNDGISQLASGTLQFKEGIDQFSSGVQTANTGASQVATGASDLNQGLGTLQSAGNQLAQGSQVLSENANLLSQGVDNLLNGTTTLYSRVNEGSEQAKAGAEKLSQGIDQLSSQTKSLNQGVSQSSQEMSAEIKVLQDLITTNTSMPEAEKQKLLDEINTLENNVNQLSSQTVSEQTIDHSTDSIKSGIQSLAGGSNEILGGIASLQSGVATLGNKARLFAEKEGELASGIEQLQKGIHSAKTGSDQLTSGSQTLASGLDQLNNSAAQLSDSSSDLSNGAKQAESGSNRLTSGLNDLDQGVSDLSEGLSTANNKVNEKTFSVDQSADHISDPVQIVKQPFNHVDEYGPAFAPYFLSLGLYVGMFLFCSAYPLTTSFGSRSGLSFFTGKLGILLIMGILQAIVLAILTLIMGLQPTSVLKFILFTVLSSWCYGTILLFINAALGTVGRFVTMAILILQLTAAAGSFPLEMLPSFFKVINPYIPMTYTILGFKSLLSATESSSLTSSTYILIGFLIIGAIASCLYYLYRFNKDRKKAAEATPKEVHA